jgi:hypothetical protein
MPTLRIQNSPMFVMRTQNWRKKYARGSGASYEEPKTRSTEFQLRRQYGQFIIIMYLQSTAHCHWGRSLDNRL